MARRMFSDEVTQTDAFLDMPQGSQLLYFHLGVSADDDGFISSPKMVMRVIRAGEDDLKLLFVKKFLLTFEAGICVVKHWRMNNYIRKDIYKPTKYTREKQMLFIRENGAYTFNPENALPVPEGHFTVPESTQKKLPSTERRRDVHLGKVSKGKVSKGKVSKVNYDKNETYGEYENVYIIKKEYERLLDFWFAGDQSLLDSFIFQLSTYIKSNGYEKKYKSHSATILAWAQKKHEDIKNRKASRGKKIVGL